jgi:hypothetical protein
MAGGIIDQTQNYYNHTLIVSSDDLKAHNLIIILNSCGFAFACCFIFLNARMVIQSPKRIFILNLFQSICAATGLFSLGVFNQVAYPHSCATMMFFNIFGTALCIGLCQLVCVERLATIVNKKWVWGISLPLICSHIVLYCYMYLTEEYSIDQVKVLTISSLFSPLSYHLLTITGTDSVGSLFEP